MIFFYNKTMENKTKENIILIGFMAAGKSTIGKMLAERTGRSFVDTDLLIEAKLNKTVADIFAEDGEECFRAEESVILSELQPHSSLVIATGGGIVINPKNRDLLKKLGKVIWLKISLADLNERVPDSASRPLLLKPKNKIEKLLQKRDNYYRGNADIIIDASGDNPDEILKKIEKSINYDRSVI